MPPVPPGGGGPAPVMGPYSPVDAIKYGWAAFTKNVGPFLVVTALLLVVGTAINLVINLGLTGSAISTGGDVDPDTGLPENFVMQQVASLVSSFVVGVFSWVVGMGLARGALDVVDTGQTTLGAMFSRIPWGQAIVAGLLVWLATSIGTLLCIIPGLIAAYMLYYATYAVLDGRSATDALGDSFRFTKDNLGDTILFLLLGVVVVIAGICACFIGLVVAMPVLYIGAAYTWRALQGRQVHPV